MRRASGSADENPADLTKTRLVWGAFSFQRSPLPRSEETVAGVPESGQDVTLFVEAAVESRAIHDDVGMFAREPANAFRRGDQAHEANARRAGPFERRDRGDSAPACREHWVEQKEIAFGGVAGDLEVVFHRLECVVVAIEADVADPRPGNEAVNPFDHPEAGPQNR